MFKYLLILFIVWYQTQGRTFDVRADTQIDTKSLTSNYQNNSEEELNKRHVVVMNGHNNYQVGQQIFYIYNEEQSKQLTNNKAKLNGYIITPGISAHKLHPRKLTWNKARQACDQEGGHLAIINSESEEKVLLRILEEKTIKLAWLGLHDYFEENDWVTVTGEALENTGFTRWTTKWPNEPDNLGGNQNCGSLIVEGGMDDIGCDSLLSFFCEIPL